MNDVRRNFYIDSLVVSGDGVRDSVVRFSPGWNILLGESDSGKTMVLNCIAYVFGKDNCPVTRAMHGYDSMRVELVSSDGTRVSLQRESLKSKVLVHSDCSEIEDGFYYLDNKKDKRQLNDLLLSLIGVEPVPELASNSNSDKKLMTWKNLIRSFYLDKQRLLNDDDLLEPKSGTEKTLFLSILLYLIYGKDFSYNTMLKKEITRAKYEAKSEYIKQKASDIKSRKAALESRLANHFGTAIPNDISAYSSQLEMLEEQIRECTERSNGIYSAICSKTKEFNEKRSSFDSYTCLRDQYLADIRRLNSIVEFGGLLSEKEGVDDCPFCHSHISPEFQETNVLAAKAELSKTLVLLNGLSDTMKQISSDMVNLEHNLQCLEEEKQVLESRITEDLKPECENIRDGIEAYEQYWMLISQERLYADILEEMAADEVAFHDQLESELQNLKDRKYSPKEHFDAGFVKGMTALLQSILKECGYRFYQEAAFDLRSFDIKIKGYEKPMLHGQGLCTFMSSVLYLAFQTYLNEKGRYCPGILMLDTPLLGLSESMYKKDSDRIRDSFFHYFMEKPHGFQIFATCHPEDIPSWVDRSSIGIIDLKADGRNGFLVDYRPEQVDSER